MTDLNQEHDSFIEHLPHWAERTVRANEDGYLTIHSQLCTRDGRRTGNAVVHRVEPLTEWVVTVITDMGSTMVLNRVELEELFFPPTYIMKADAVGKRMTRDHQVSAPAVMTDEQATLLNQAHDMLLSHAEDQRLKGNDSEAMGAFCSADAVLKLAAAWASAPAAEQAETAGLRAAVGHLSVMVDGQTQLVRKAVAIMTALHESATPNEDGPDVNAIIPGASFRQFVDGHAELMFALANGPQITTAPPARPSREPMTEGTARQFVEWMKAQPDDREPTTIDGALAEFQANLRHFHGITAQGKR